MTVSLGSLRKSWTFSLKCLSLVRAYSLQTLLVELIFGFSNILQIFTENTFHYLEDNLAFTVNLALCIKLFTAS